MAASRREQFGTAVVAQLRAHVGIESASYGPAFTITYRIRGADGHVRDAAIDLAGLYERLGGEAGEELERLVEETLSEPSPDIEPVLSDLERAVADLPDAEKMEWEDQGWEQVCSRLFPVLEWSDIKGAHTGVIARDCVPFLVEMVAIRGADLFHLVTKHDVDSWAVDVDDVFAAARANLDESTSMMDLSEPPEIHTTDGERFFGYEGGISCSSPLAQGWFDRAAEWLGGRPVLFMPTQGLLLVGLESDMTAGSRLGLHALRLFDEEAEHPLSPVPYTVDVDGQLTPLRVPETHRAWINIRQSQAWLATSVYNQQAEQLNSAQTSQDSMAFAELRKIVSEEWNSTYVLWEAGRDRTWLPQAEHVVFVPAERDAAVFMAPWDEVFERVDLVRVAGYSPSRFLVGPHPSVEVMAELRARGRLLPRK